jgi:TetR/AcrR family transcriptional regulator, transcriptional repressor for nem operon
MRENARMVKAQRAEETDTEARILDVAERLVEVRGINGFSYADVAAELRVTKASLHYHFAGKAELGEALIQRYASRFNEALDRIAARRVDARTKLDACARLYTEVMRDERMCLCGMLAAEYQTLPEPMREAVLRFFDENEGWLVSVLEQGEREGSLKLTAPPGDVARMIVGGLEGAMLVARTYGDLARFRASASRLIGSLTGSIPRGSKLR